MCSIITRDYIVKVYITKKKLNTKVIIKNNTRLQQLDYFVTQLYKL